MAALLVLACTADRQPPLAERCTEHEIHGNCEDFYQANEERHGRFGKFDCDEGCDAVWVCSKSGDKPAEWGIIDQPCTCFTDTGWVCNTDEGR